MLWNWQKPDWPNFTWERARISTAEEQFLFNAGVAIGTLRHLVKDQQGKFLALVMSREAVASAAMDGETLDPASVRSLLSHHVGASALDQSQSMPVEQGNARMLIDLHRSFAQPLSDDMLFAWSRMVAGEGTYRTSAEPMRLLSGPAAEPTVHFEAPPARQIPAQMKRFVSWFNRTAAQGTEPLPAITRAGIAYLFFDAILPFDRGNGQIARVLAQKALLQGFAQPMPVPLTAAILADAQGYYRTILGANRRNEISQWLVWFAGTTLQAQRRSMVLAEFIVAQANLLDKMRSQINERQQRALEHIFDEGPEGLKQGLTAGHYSATTGASPATTTRDLVDLVQKGALLRTGERKHARYRLSLVGPD